MGDITLSIFGTTFTASLIERVGFNKVRFLYTYTPATSQVVGDGVTVLTLPTNPPLRIYQCDGTPCGIFTIYDDTNGDSPANWWLLVRDGNNINTVQGTATGITLTAGDKYLIAGEFEL